MEKFLFYLSIFGGIAGLATIIGLVYYFIDRKINATVGKLKTYTGNTKIIFGSNTFIGCPNVLVIDDKPVFSAVIQSGLIFKKRKKLLVSIIIFDKDNNLIAQLEKNKWTLNHNKLFKKEIKKNKIKIFNNSGEVALECTAQKDGAVVVNGYFYINGRKFIATNDGLQIN
jgi:hypothetical protein